MTSTEITTLSNDEMVLLDELVAVVDRTITSFIECGTALAAIRDNKLYRETHSTFEAFVLERWEMTARRARQYMGAASIVAELPSGTPVPLTERHARELMPLRDEPELMAEALAIADEITGGKITSEALRLVVAEIVRVTSPPKWNGKVHELCAALPMVPDHELEAIAESIATHGLLLDGILLPDGTMLDGMVRQRACEIAGVEMRWSIYEGDDVVDLWRSLNLLRRHANEGQRAIAAVELMKLADSPDFDSRSFGVWQALNLARRHMSEDQRAMLAVSLMDLMSDQAVTA